MKPTALDSCSHDVFGCCVLSLSAGMGCIFQLIIRPWSSRSLSFSVFAQADSSLGETPCRAWDSSPGVPGSRLLTKKGLEEKVAWSKVKKEPKSEAGNQILKLVILAWCRLTLKALVYLAYGCLGCESYRTSFLTWKWTRSSKSFFLEMGKLRHRSGNNSSSKVTNLFYVTASILNSTL